MTLSQQKLYYREAVILSLEHFYGISHPEAVNIVWAWWHRMMGSGSLQKGMFLHQEPINAAADLLHTEEKRDTDDFWPTYEEKVLKVATERIQPFLRATPQKIEHALLNPERIEEFAVETSLAKIWNRGRDKVTKTEPNLLTSKN